MLVSPHYPAACLGFEGQLPLLMIFNGPWLGGPIRAVCVLPRGSWAQHLGALAAFSLSQWAERSTGSEDPCQEWGKFCLNHFTDQMEGLFPRRHKSPPSREQCLGQRLPSTSVGGSPPQTFQAARGLGLDQSGSRVPKHRPPGACGCPEDGFSTSDGHTTSLGVMH